MANNGNVIQFPTRRPRGMSELEILQGTLIAVLERLDQLEELDEDSTQSMLITFETVVEWLEERLPE